MTAPHWRPFRACGHPMSPGNTAQRSGRPRCRICLAAGATQARRSAAAGAVPVPTSSTALREFRRLCAVGVDIATARFLAVELVARRTRAGRPASTREHGSERGYRQHRTDREAACDACRAAHSRHNLAQRITAVPVPAIAA